MIRSHKQARAKPIEPNSTTAEPARRRHTTPHQAVNHTTPNPNFKRTLDPSIKRPCEQVKTVNKTAANVFVFDANNDDSEVDAIIATLKLKEVALLDWRWLVCKRLSRAQRQMLIADDFCALRC